MSQVTEGVTLKDKLKKMKMPVTEINKFLAYVNGEKSKEQGKDKKPVTSNTETELYTMAFKYWGLGLVIDGVNVVITGKNMAMITYNGYKNKVKSTYPEAIFDVQLVREGDTFNVSKEDGQVIYSHQLGDPFNDTQINGAYCIIKIGKAEYLEVLNRRDYEEMQKGSKQSYLWDKWSSEFWLKSVIKRACKRHFNDITVELDKADNDSFGQADKPQDRKAMMLAAERKHQSLDNTGNFTPSAVKPKDEDKPSEE